MTDPILDEIRQIRDAHAARFNYDLDAIFADIKRCEREGGLVFVNGVARQQAASNPPSSAEMSMSGDGLIIANRT